MVRKHWRRLLAPVLVGIVVAAYFISAQPSKTRPVVPLGPAALQQAAFNGGAHIYLRYDKVSGTPAGALGHANDLPILSFNWGVSRPSAIAAGVQTVAPVSVADVNVVHVMDKYSIKLLHEAFAGKSGATATVFIERVQGTPPAVVESLTYKLDNALVSADSPSFSGSGTESISLSFTKVTVTYGVPSNPAISPTTESWDVTCKKATC
jgi:type VI protein secretion system component Hcp